jgi:hypothetical protein
MSDSPHVALGVKLNQERIGAVPCCPLEPGESQLRELGAPRGRLSLGQ